VVGGGTALKKGDTWTLRDERGKVVATGTFDQLQEFSHGLAPAGRAKNWGVIDRQGKWLIEPRFSRVLICGANCVLGLTRSDWRFYDRNGKQLPGPAYDRVLDLGHGYFRAGGTTIVNTSSGRVVEVPYQEMGSFNDGLAAFKAGGKWGYLDSTGQVAVKPAYDEAHRAYDGVAAVKLGKSWHLIDRKGARTGDQEYLDIGQFSRGLARVQLADGDGFVDKSGRVVFSLGESWLRLLDGSGKPLGRPILHQLGARGGHLPRHQPVVLSADAIGIGDYPTHVRLAASLFSLGSDRLTSELDPLGNVAAVLAVLSLVAGFLLGPAPAGRFMRGLAVIHGAVTGANVRAVGRKTAKGLGYLALFVVALILILVAINLFDEKLDPEVAAYLKQDPPKLPADARNGYFYFVGLAAKSDPHAAGMKYVAELNEAQTKRLKGEKVDWPKEFDKLSLSDPKICATDNAPCLSRVADNESYARRIVTDNKLLLERYRALLEYPEYAESQPLRTWDAPLMSFQPLTYAQRAFFVAAALKVRDGQAEAALADVEKSLAFSRRMLAGSRTLIGRFVATAQMQRSAMFMSEILQARRGSLAASAARLDRSLRPLSDDERRLTESFRAEFGSFTPIASSAGCKRGQLKSIGDDPPLLMTLPCFFLQENATINRLYFTSHKPFLEVDAAPAREFEKMRSERRPPKSDFPTFDAIYNPFGKAIVAIGITDWSDYTASMHDRDAMLRLVSLQALIVAKKIGNTDVPKFAAQAGSRYHDPYTGAPMRWDATRGELYFEPKSERVKRIATEGRLAVKL
jgi:hypothetical protein